MRDRRETGTLKAVAALALLTTVFTASSSAGAQGKDPAAAVELFQQGREALEAGDFDVACSRFAESQRFDPRVGTLLNLGHCEEARGHLADAFGYWQQAVHLAESTSDPRLEEASQRLHKCEARVPRLVLELSSRAPETVEIRRDGVTVARGVMGVALPVNPGGHTVLVSCPGHAARSYEFQLSEGETKTLELEPGAAVKVDTPKPDSRPSPKPPQPPPKKQLPPVSSSSNSRDWGYVLTAVGLAGVTVGAATGLMLMSKDDTIDEHCNADKRCDEEGAEAASDASTLEPINLVSWSVGIVGLGAGGYLLLTAEPSNGDTTGFAAAVGGTF